MDDRSVFQIVSDIFKEEKIDGILIGGFAINFYQISRQTNDIDFMIATDDLSAMTKALERSGFKCFESAENFSRFKKPHSFMMGIDLILVSPETLQEIRSSAKEATLVKWKFKVPSLNHLMALKLHAIKNNPTRILKDLPDVVNLIRKHKIKPQSEAFKALCYKYGTKEIYDKLMEFIR